MRGTLFILPAVLLLCGCTSLKMERYLHSRPDDWPMFARDALHSSISSAELRPPLVLAWEQDVAGGVGNGSPVIVDSVVFVGNLRGELRAINARTGKAIGSVMLGEAIQGSPVIDGTVAFVALSNSKESIVAYDLFNGKARWVKSYGDVEVTPLLYGGRLFFGNTAGVFYSIERATGDVRWKFEIPGNTKLYGIRSSAAADSGTVLFGAEDGRIYALNAETGALRWTYDTGAPVSAAVLIGGELLFTGNRNGSVIALERATGRLMWRTDVQGSILAHPVAAGGLVIVATMAGKALGLRAKDGSQMWAADLGGPVTAGGVVSGGVLYAGTLRKQVFALSVSDGTLLWKVDAGGRIRTSPALASGNLFIATDERSLLAFRQETP